MYYKGYIYIYNMYYIYYKDYNIQDMFEQHIIYYK